MRRRIVRETPDELERLQELLDRSIEEAGAFLRSSFQMPTHSLSARQLATYLQGIQTVAFSTVTAAGQPRVAPIGAIFHRAEFYIPTVMTAMRTRHVSRRPPISLTHYDGIDLAIIVHGRAVIINQEQPEFDTLEAIHRTSGSESVRDWGEGAFLRVMADVIFTFARFPERFPERRDV